MALSSRAFPVLALALAACAHQGAADKQLNEMSDTIGKVQVDQDSDNRAFMEETAPGASARPVAAKSAVPPPPRTVQINDPGDDGANADPEDPAARPEIKVQGARGAASPPRSVKPARAGTPTPPEETLRTDGSRSSALDPEAKRTYEDGIHLVQSKQYDRALEVLSGFLTKWPDHPYVENALYWKGECLYARGEYLRAAEQFEAVVTRFGAGKKGADALLKLGMVHDRLGASDRAREYWDRLRRDYPHSDVTKKIPASETNRGSGPKETR